MFLPYLNFQCSDPNESDGQTEETSKGISVIRTLSPEVSDCSKPTDSGKS